MILFLAIHQERTQQKAGLHTLLQYFPQKRSCPLGKWLGSLTKPPFQQQKGPFLGTYTLHKGPLTFSIVMSYNVLDISFPSIRTFFSFYTVVN